MTKANTAIGSDAKAVAPKISVVAMDAVPDPTANEPGKYGEMFEQICQLKIGTALRVEFASNSHALYARSRLRKLAKEKHLMLSSSKENRGATRYFWLEKTK